MSDALAIQLGSAWVSIGDSPPIAVTEVNTTVSETVIPALSVRSIRAQWTIYMDRRLWNRVRRLWKQMNDRRRYNRARRKAVRSVLAGLASLSATATDETALGRATGPGAPPAIP